MSQIKFDTPLQVNLVFSKQHKRFLLLTHIVAGLSLLPLGLQIGIKLLLIGYVIFSFFYLNKKTRRYYSGELHYLDENNWVWINQNEVKLQLYHGYILLPQLLLLNFIDAKDRKHAWLLFPDSVDNEILRKVRILIHHSTAETISPPV